VCSREAPLDLLEENAMSEEAELSARAITHPAATAGADAPDTGLRQGALHTGGVVMQNIANIAPAIAVLFTVQQIASYAGVAAPLAYLIAFFVTLCLGTSLGQLVRKLPSAGSYYTFISRTTSPDIGFIAAWLYFLTFPLVGAQASTAMGSTINEALHAYYGVSFPWWAFALIILAFTAIVCFVGITAGIRALFITSAIEIVLILALAISGIVSPGPGGLNAHGFNPAAISGHGTFYLAVVFAIFALTGWDAAAPLAEESARPRRTVSRGVVLSILLMGFFLVVASWGLQIGWGTAHVGSFVNDASNPAFSIAHRVWGSAWVLVLIALANSVIAVLISSMNAATRMWFRMARVGVLPRWLGYVHPRFKTPSNAIIAQTLLSLLLAFGLSAAWGVENVFSVLGFLFIFGAIPVWVIANYSVFRLYRTEHRDEFNIFLHLIVPIIGTVGLIWFGYKSVVPLPPYPNSWALPLVIAWLVIAVVIVVWLRRRGKERELQQKAGLAFDESAPVSE
jgi:amino acid transporter